MTPLHPSMVVQLGRGETPQSYCSRTALLLGRSARNFCRDMSLSFQGIVDGDVQALEALAHRTRADAGSLAAGAVLRVGERRYSIRNQALVRDSLSRKALRVCPHCLLKDLDERSDPLAVRPFGRAVWLIDSIRTCPQHDVGLIAIADDDHPQRVHDFANLIQHAIPRMAQFAEEAPRRSASAFERHLLDRCEGLKIKDAPFLQSLPFYAAAKSCEVIGAIAAHGIRFRSERLTESDWYHAGAEGFRIASGGEVGIRSFLSSLQEHFASTKGDWGPRMVFGRLYEWLAHESEDDAYHPLRNIIQHHVIETMPIGPGEDIFGQEITVRRLHSIRSASLEIGAHPKRLRKLLHAAGHVKSQSMALSDERVMFDALEAQDFLARVSEAMNLRKAGEYLNAPRPHERLLADAGFIQPFVRGGTGLLRDFAFAKRDLDAFLGRLLEKATDAGISDGALVPIPVAAKRACCSAMEIVRLILDRKLACIRRRADVAGYLSVLVDPEEVKPYVQGRANGSLSLREVEQRLRTKTQVVKALVERGHLPSRIEVNPVNRCPRQIVACGDLEHFMSRFVSLHVAATDSGIHFRKLKTMLASARIDPVFPPGEVHAAFYDRNVIADLGL
ncbi:TniQ family protein [Microvirga sp. VF16]|nr:TniQ family protein [Microvirga sp. VF16]